jgi:hypothetical protein
VQNFYRLLTAVDEKVHDGTDVTVLQAVTRLMAMKSKYIISNQCYHDIVKLIIDLIPTKHNMPKDLYQSKKIMSGLGMNYEKIDVWEKNCMLFWKGHKDDTKCMHCGRSRYMKVRMEMVSLLPQKWQRNIFITYLSHQGRNSSSCLKKQRSK